MDIVIIRFGWRFSFQNISPSPKNPWHFQTQLHPGTLVALRWDGCFSRARCSCGENRWSPSLQGGDRCSPSIKNCESKAPGHVPSQRLVRLHLLRKWRVFQGTGEGSWLVMLVVRARCFVAPWNRFRFWQLCTFPSPLKLIMGRVQFKKFGGEFWRYWSSL